jgi:hypothetical protein
VASRSDGDGDDAVDPKPPEEGVRSRLSFHRSDSPDGDHGAEFTVHLRFGYKTILLVVVLFDVTRRIVGEAISRDWFGILPD